MGNQNETVLWSQKEVSQFFGVSLTTIWRWEKQGKIVGYGVGGRRFYKKDQVISALVPKL